jgi:hypothetical protein
VPNPLDPTMAVPVKNAAVIGIRTVVQY